MSTGVQVIVIGLLVLLAGWQIGRRLLPTVRSLFGGSGPGAGRACGSATASDGACGGCGGCGPAAAVAPPDAAGTDRAIRIVPRR
jgi:hypothetical protein